ncbi:MAG: YitT family protein [Desulfopila sp.]
MSPAKRQLLSSISWNLLLITVGSLIYGIGVKAIVVPQNFITGGITGVSLLCYYVTDILSPGIWYFVINAPLFLVGWKLVSRRFFLYSLFGMVMSSIWFELITFTIPLHDPFLVMLAGGTIVGAGAGVVFHSLGSLGGNDIIAIVLHQKFNIRIGTFFFAFNLVLFAFSFGALNLEMVLYSLAMSFITSFVLEHVLTMFNQRKMVLIISEAHEIIARDINKTLRRGCTYLEGKGAYSGREKKIILTVVHNYQLKRLESLALHHDPSAFMITENTFNVLGKGFSKQKVY